MESKLRETANDHKPRHDQPDEVVEGKVVVIAGTTRVKRDFPPAHYLFKIKSFSLFSDSKKDKYESGIFEAGGHKWSLLFYPRGVKKENEDGFISLYLEIAETKSLPASWEANVLFKLFVLDQIHDKYLAVEAADGQVKRFYNMKTRRGFDKFLSMKAFNEPSNGYLKDDCCVFGAEVFVVERTGNLGCFSLIRPPAANSTITWEIKDFSKLNQEVHYSEIYRVMELQWSVVLYPKGSGQLYKGKALSVFLELVDAASVLQSGERLYAEIKLRVRDGRGSNHREREAAVWFSRSFDQWGFSDLMTLKDLQHEESGYVVNDKLVLEADFNIIWKPSALD